MDPGYTSTKTCGLLILNCVKVSVVTALRIIPCRKLTSCRLLANMYQIYLCVEQQNLSDDKNILVTVLLLKKFFFQIDQYCFFFILLKLSGTIIENSYVNTGLFGRHYVSSFIFVKLYKFNPT